MAKFDPTEFNYELVGERDGIFHFQKSIEKKELLITDIFELAFWSKEDTWVIFIETINLKQFLPQILAIENNKVYLFVGTIKNDFDFRFLMARSSKNAKLLLQLPS